MNTLNSSYVFVICTPLNNFWMLTTFKKYEYEFKVYTRDNSAGKTLGRVWRTVCVSASLLQAKWELVNLFIIVYSIYCVLF